MQQLSDARLTVPTVVKGSLTCTCTTVTPARAVTLEQLLRGHTIARLPIYVMIGLTSYPIVMEVDAAAEVATGAAPA